MSSERGWLSAVTKLLSTGQKSGGSPCDREQNRGNIQDSTSESSRLISPNRFIPSNGEATVAADLEVGRSSRQLRYLSPSVLESGAAKVNISEAMPAEDIFATSSNTSRKRTLTQDQRPSTAMDSLLSLRDNPKRSRREQFASSMLEDLTPRMFSDRLNSTWMGKSTEDSFSCIDFCHSPSSSNRSLIGRIGSNRSNSSSLSSKTKAILSHLERINTPARESRKLPVMRGSTVPSERWAPTHSCAPPPLLKTSATAPSRIQLLSSSLASHRKPYWRDITRKLQEKEVSASSVNRDSTPSGSSLYPLFDLKGNGSISGGCNAAAELPISCGDVNSTMTNVSAGKERLDNAKRNVFNADELVDDDLPGAEQDNASHKPFSAPPTKTPQSEDSDDVVFTFAAPIKRLPGHISEDISPESSHSGSEGTVSSSDDSEDDQNSLHSNEEQTLKENTYKKSSQPPTAPCSETSSAFSSSTTPTSSQDVSQRAEVESSWSCPQCFVTNKNVSSCPCCGHNKDGEAAPKTLMSSIPITGKLESSGYRFGLADGKLKSCDISSTSASDPAPSQKQATSTTVGQSMLTSSSTSAATTNRSESTSFNTSTALSKTGEPAKKRVAWICPDCMVQNKDTDDKCVCCGHIMYTTKDASCGSTNVFGDRAFKTTDLPSGVSFGFGTSNSGFVVPGNLNSGLGSIEGQAPSAIPKSKFQEENSLPLSSALAGSPPVVSMESSISKTSSTPAFGFSAGKNEKAMSQNSTATAGVTTSIFGASAKPPLFAPSSTTSFNSSFSAGSLLVPSSSAATITTTAAPSVSESIAVATAVPAPFQFGTASNASCAKPFGLFDSKGNAKEQTPVTKAVSFGNGPVFGGSSQPSNNIFGTAQVMGTTGTSVTSSSGTSLFGASSASKPLFSSFNTVAEPSKPFLGGAANSAVDGSKSSSFSGSLSSGDAQKPVFGASAISKPLFGSSPSVPPAAPTINGGLTFNFGSSSSGTFGTFAANSSTLSAPSVPSTSSNVSVFGNVAGADNAPKPFQFGSAIPEPTFQFGQTSALSGSTPFQFGSSSSNALAAPPFQMPGISVPAAPSSNFSFTSSSSSSGARKMVSARRRLPQRK